MEIWKLLKKEDKKIAAVFNDQRRSNAIFKIAALRSYGYLSDEEMKGFSTETQEKVKIITKELKKRYGINPPTCHCRLYIRAEKHIGKVDTVGELDYE